MKNGFPARNVQIPSNGNMDARVAIYELDPLRNGKRVKASNKSTNGHPTPKFSHFILDENERQ